MHKIIKNYILEHKLMLKKVLYSAIMLFFYNEIYVLSESIIFSRDEMWVFIAFHPLIIFVLIFLMYNHFILKRYYDHFTLILFELILATTIVYMVDLRLSMSVLDLDHKTDYPSLFIFLFMKLSKYM